MSNTTVATNAVANDSEANGLRPDSYTSLRLKHASPEHLHYTTRRFFIGPIPEGWLNSNRKSWYKRRLELSNYSSRQATFHAAEDGQLHQRTASGLAVPSLATRMQFSFPQPEDIFDGNNHDQEHLDNEAEEDDEEVETTALAPVNTEDLPQLAHRADSDDASLLTPTEAAPAKQSDNMYNTEHGQSAQTIQPVESFITAQEDQTSTLKHVVPEEEDQVSASKEPVYLQSTSNATASRSVLQTDGGGASADNIDSNSRTALLRPETPLPEPHDEQNYQPMKKHAPAPVNSPGRHEEVNPRASGVRFKVSDEAEARQRRVERRLNDARYRVANRLGRRATLREGMIVKMERMLVRMDVTMQALPDEFDENESIKTETKQIEKWTEFMVVARKSNKENDEDFRLQLYKTRVIPEIENESTKKKPAREIKLLPKTTHVNLYSTLDKTVVIWHPYRKGTRILIMRPSSAAHSVEWYTFLRDALGWNRPTTLQVNVPDLDVTLHLDRPFQGLEAASVEATDEQTAITKTIEAEKAVATKIVSESMKMLENDPEWAEVLKQWSETALMGLAWKRYDRLEWVYGVNEQKMFGSMAMQHSYDLELRPKHHYPTSTRGKKGVLHEEPAPVEGFLVRLTSQKGIHRRLGKAFFKRLYFSTQNQFLVFNRPAKVTPPHPPRLVTISGTNVPSSSEIVKQTPTMYDIEPYKIENGRIKWMNSEHQSTARQQDAEAVEEIRRNTSNLIASDGYINMCQIVKVRKIKWGATEADEHLDSGSDVDFHADVDNTMGEDGTTKELDDDRIFELVLDNQLIIRLQAYNKETRKEWMKRLRKLVKYWKLRTAGDITDLKSVRKSNLTQLNIDEEMEARLGQFARKWEVSRSDASPELYNMCRLASCRTITMSGMLYRKARRHATFQRCSVILTNGQMLIYQATLRKGTGKQVPHIHQEKQQIVDLRDCYVYSGLIVEDDLLYQNRTFDANHAGMLAPTPRIYLEDAWTSADVDVMTCFVVWMNRRKGWFRSVTTGGGDAGTQSGGEAKEDSSSGRRSRIKRVAQLGVPGRGMVFKCRSRAERDLWVLSVAAEIENAVEKELCEQGKTMEQGLAEVRLEH